jgi:hypothetical protein
VKGQHTGAWRAIHLNVVLEHFGLTNSFVVEITIDNASSNESITLKLQATRECSGIKWPALQNHLSCIADVIQLDFVAFMGRLSVKGSHISGEPPQRYQHCRDNQTTDIGNSQSLRKEGHARTNKAPAVMPRLVIVI